METENNDINTLQQYRLDNREKNIKYQKQYYQDHKEDLLNNLKEYLDCDICNGSYQRINKRRHEGTAKHLKATGLVKDDLKCACGGINKYDLNHKKTTIHKTYLEKLN